jgi:hypothetical protein
MKTFVQTNQNRALTLIEVLGVCAMLGILALIFLSAISRPPMQRAPRIQCINNLKQVGLATRVWEGDHNDRFPAQEPATNGGSMEYITGTNVWRHFQVMSNELSTPKVVICPADEARIYATNFTWFNNSNVSFFFGIDANETNSSMMLSGDRNITNGAGVKNGILGLTTTTPAGWTSEMHDKCGNIALADGSVQQLSITGLGNTVRNTGIATNRLQMPVLTP